METDFCNYADEATIYACDKTLDSVVARLGSDSSIVIQWFGDNFMKITADKQVISNIGDSVLENTEEEKLLGVVIDKNLLLIHISVCCVRRLVANFLPSLA